MANFARYMLVSLMCAVSASCFGVKAAPTNPLHANVTCVFEHDVDHKCAHLPFSSHLQRLITALLQDSAHSEYAAHLTRVAAD